MAAPGYQRFNDLGELSRYLGRVIERVNPAVTRAMTDTSQGLLDRTIPFTPIEFGPLRASGRVTPGIRAGGHITVSIVFGGAAAKYAVYVHERVVTRRGRKVFHASPTRAKFLSSTAQASFPLMQAEMFARTVPIFLKG